MMNTDQMKSLVEQFLNQKGFDNRLVVDADREYYTDYCINILISIQDAGLDLDTLGPFALVALTKSVCGNMRNFWYDMKDNADADYDETYDEGYEDGRVYGYDQGFSKGWNEGYEEGHQDGCKKCAENED